MITKISVLIIKQSSRSRSESLSSTASGNLLHVIYDKRFNQYAASVIPSRTFIINRPGLTIAITTIIFIIKISQHVLFMLVISYDLRIKNPLQIPKVKTSSYGQSSLSFRGSIPWNTLSDSIKSVQNTEEFKTMIIYRKGESCSCIICK